MPYDSGMFRCDGAPSLVRALPMIGAALLFAGGSPASGSAAGGRTIYFVCENGTGFAVSYVAGRAQITTRAGRWLLERRPSSIGRKYSSDTAAFIHDEDRGALNGLPGGPFRRCREAGSRLTETGANGPRP